MSLRFSLSGLSIDSGQEKKEYDIIIIGGGPAGLTAALYSARYKLSSIVITELIGGYMSEAPLVDDYPGLPETPGNELVKKFVNHVKKYDVPIIVDKAVDVIPKDDKWIVRTLSGKEYVGKAVIIAIGSKKRKLGVPGEDKLVGRGVSYCTTCDGPLFKDKVVAVIGGGNSAVTGALYLAEIASKVYLIHRRDEFRAFKVYVSKAENNPKITILKNYVVTEILGKERVEGIRIKNKKTGNEKILKVDGVFIEIGLVPPTEFFRSIGVKTDENGYAKVSPDQSTNLPGIYVAGDAAGGPCKYRFEQIITAAAEGAKAADAAFKYIMYKFSQRNNT